MATGSSCGGLSLWRPVAANQSQGDCRPRTPLSRQGQCERIRRAIDLELILIKDTRPAPGHTDAMKAFVHRISCLLLALALVLTGPGLAGPAKGALLVELCAGDTPRMIWIDAEGNPIQPDRTHVKCLDCLQFSAPSPETASLRLIPELLRVPTGLSLPIPPEPLPIAHLRPIPRGPPAVKSETVRLGDPRPKPWSLYPSAPQQLDIHQTAFRAPATDLRAIPESARA